jgi:NADP-dependent alcohol dehydrogenase
MIGHELTAMYGIDHARTLAVIAPSLYKVMFETKKKSWHNTENVFSIGDDEIANEAIAKTVEFSIPWEWILNYLITQKTMIKPLILLLIVLTKEVGKGQNITLDKVKSIVEMSY